ncbi:MAG: undecaprenyl-phosphate glucose phosphotransferase [Gammaproteobacteria bacterium]
MGAGVLRRHAPLITAITRALDAVLCVAGAFLALWFRFGTTGVSMTPDYGELVALGALAVVIVFPLAGVYQSWRSGSVLLVAARVLAAWFAVFVLLMVFLVATKQAESFSRLWLISWFASAAVLLMALRIAAYAALQRLRRRGFNIRRVAIVGNGTQARDLVRRTRREVWAGFVVTRVFAPAPATGKLDDVTIEPLTVLASWVESERPDEVWIALPLEQGTLLREVLAQLHYSTANVRYAPDLFGLSLLNRGVTEMLSVPMLDLSASPMDGVNRLVKGFEDRLLAAVILVLASPVMVLVAVSVKLSSLGPVFYRQERVGWNGRVFEMLKFRSMRADAEVTTGAMWANRDDDRSTRLGRFIRRTSLDELPQFFNVLKGEMSIVGPRPERPVFVEQFKSEIPGYMQKHMIKAGITGLAQINGWRGRTDLSKRIEHDRYYIEHWSLWLDLKIIFLTLFTGFVNRNAY